MNDQSEMVGVEFFSWAFGDRHEEELGEMAAEFLVHKAIGGVTPRRISWGAYDVVTSNGTTIEVKCAGTMKLGGFTNPPNPTYEIRMMDPWLVCENRYLGKSCRYADVWIFVFYREDCSEFSDPFNVDQWEYLVTTSSWLYEMFGDQKTVRRSVLLAKGLEPVRFTELENSVDILTHCASIVH